MYIFQKNYQKLENLQFSDKPRRIAVVIVPSEPRNNIAKFLQLVQKSINAVNEQRDASNKLEMKILSRKHGQKNAWDNYIAIYEADFIIAECTDQKANVFYMLGLAHAAGRSVCACYREKKEETPKIPFNVQGRQSMTYNLKDMPHQEKFVGGLTKWITML